MSDGEKDKDNSQGNQAQQEDDLYIRNLFDDNSFQALVQTIRNEDQNATPTQFNMPTDLQRYFANDSEDVLPIADYNDAFPPGQEPSDFISMLKTGQQDLSVTNINHDGNRGNSNNSNSNIGTSHATQQQQQFNNQQQNQLFGMPNQVSFFDDLPVGTSLQQQQQQQPQSLPSNHQTTPSPQKIVTPTQSSSSSGTMTLLDSITAQLPLERKNKFSLLFVELQKHTITAENFFTQAKYLLDDRGYRMLENLLENLKEQTPTTTDAAQGSSTPTSIDVNSSTSSTVTTSTQVSTSADNDQRKRTISSSQVRHEDSQRSMVGLMGTPQSKRSKTEHAPGMPRGLTKTANTHMNIATPPPLPTSSSEPPSLPTSSNIQNIATPEFKQPDAPANQGLQVPRSSSFSSIATPMSSIAPTTHPAPGATSSAAPSSGGGGDNRIDYDAITDVMGYAGVDLKEEVEHFMKDGGDTIGGIPVDGVDRSKSQDFMNGRLLQQLVTKLAKPLAINHVDPDVVAYLSLATQDRLRGLVEDMVKASKHRIERRSPFQRAPPTATSSSKVEYPLYKILVKADPKQALMALEQLDRKNTSSQQQNSSKLPLSLRNQGDKRWKLTSKSYGSAIRSFSVKDANDNMDQDKNVTVMDAIFALEREGQGGKGSGQKTLLKMYNQWLQ